MPFHMDRAVITVNISLSDEESFAPGGRLLAAIDGRIQHLRRAEGQTVKDDPKLLRKSLKRLEREKAKSKSRWSVKEQGVKDAKDFFTQVCALSAAPLRVMAATVAAGGDVARAAADLKAAGYAIFGTDAKNSQVELSACADASGTWHLAAISGFAATCEAA